jgi:hypothetical protein
VGRWACRSGVSILSPSPHCHYPINITCYCQHPRKNRFWPPPPPPLQTSEVFSREEERSSYAQEASADATDGDLLRWHRRRLAGQRLDGPTTQHACIAARIRRRAVSIFKLGCMCEQGRPMPRMAKKCVGGGECQPTIENDGQGGP